MPETAQPASTAFGPKKTVLILAIVVGCFGVLLPKLFFPMLSTSFAPAVPQADGSGCCDVIFESDVTAVDIMQELCLNIIRHHQVDPRVRDALASGKFNKLTPSSASLCREEVLAKCGIDLSSFLAEKERLKKSYKQVLEEIRGFNGSLCLKMQFGVPLARLGTPHLIRYHILMPHSPIRQERQTPPHAGGLHPALRERGRAIPASHIVPKIPNRPNEAGGPPIRMRPPMGGGGHAVPATKSTGMMPLLMPLYTIGIVIFFLYTLSKVLMGFFMPIYTVGNIVSFLYKILQVLKKSSDSEIIRPEYPMVDAEKEYQKVVFNPNIFAAAVTAVSGTQYEKPRHYSRVRENEPAPTIEELQQHQTPKSNGLAAGVNPNSKDTNDGEEQHDKELEEINETTPTVKVLNMEMTASCEGRQRYSRPTTPTLLTPHSHQEEKEKSPPISIYLEGSLPSQCELLVTDSKTQELLEEETMEVPVVLSGKMTLSLISLDQESQDELDNETSPTNATPSPSDKSNLKSTAGSIQEKVQVLQQEYLSEKDDYESDAEEDEDESDEELSEDDDSTDCLQNQKDQQDYRENTSKRTESDRENSGTGIPISKKTELDKHNENENSQTEDDEEDDENQDYSDEESDGESEENSEQDHEIVNVVKNNEDSEEDEELDEDEDDEVDDENEESEEDEEDEDDNDDETDQINSLRSGNDYSREEETRKTVKPLGKEKAN